MLRLLLLKEQGAVGGDVAGVAEAAAVVAVHKVGARLLLPLAVLQVISLLVGSFVIFIDCILNKLPAARIPATAWASRGRLSCLKKKEKTSVTLNMKRAKCIPPSFIMQLVELSMKYLWQILSQKLWSPSPPPLPSFQFAANTTWHE